MAELLIHLKRLRQPLSWLVILLSMLYLGWQVETVIERVDTRLITAPLLISAVTSTCLWGLGIVQLAGLWASMVADANKQHIPALRHGYLSVNIYKYLPGNAGHFIGRHIAGRDIDMSHARLIAALGAEAVGLIWAAGFWVSVLILLGTPPDSSMKPLAITGLGALALILAAVLTVPHHLPARWQAYLPMLATSVRLLIGYISFMALVAIALLLVAIQIIPPPQLLLILSLYLIAWVVGFLLPGAPGGLGARESAFLLLAGPHIGTEHLLLFALLARLINIGGDLLCFAGIKILKMKEKIL